MEGEGLCRLSVTSEWFSVFFSRRRKENGSRDVKVMRGGKDSKNMG